MECEARREVGRDERDGIRGRKSDIRSQTSEVGDQRTDDSSSKFQVPSLEL